MVKGFTKLELNFLGGFYHPGVWIDWMSGDQPTVENMVVEKNKYSKYFYKRGDNVLETWNILLTYIASRNFAIRVHECSIREPSIAQIPKQLKKKNIAKMLCLRVTFW